MVMAKGRLSAKHKLKQLAFCMDCGNQFFPSRRYPVVCKACSRLKRYQNKS